MRLVNFSDLMEWVAVNTYSIIEAYEGEVEVVFPDELRKFIRQQETNNFELICDAIDEDPVLEEAVKAYILTGRYE